LGFFSGGINLPGGILCAPPKYTLAKQCYAWLAVCTAVPEVAIHTADLRKDYRISTAPKSCI